MASQAFSQPRQWQRQQYRKQNQAQQQQEQQLRKPVFITVDQLLPGTSGHTLVVKVVSSKMVVQKYRPNLNNIRQVRISECLVGDHTGVIVFTARNEQDESRLILLIYRVLSEPGTLIGFDLVKEGATLILRNAKIDMFRGSMRLAVDRWGRVEVTDAASFTVKEDNNLSLVEYELVNVTDD